MARLNHVLKVRVSRDMRRALEGICSWLKLKSSGPTPRGPR